MKLTDERVTEIFRDCLVSEAELPTATVVDLITCTVGLSPSRLATHKAEIGDMLRELPPQFRKEFGGGWSFLQACEDRHGNQWTGLHKTMAELFGLGIATGQAEYLLPRDIWSALPGGMPYIVVTVDGYDEQDQEMIKANLNAERAEAQAARATQ